MDVPTRTRTWGAFDLEFFGYGERKAVVLKKLDGEECIKDILYTKEDWEKWFDFQSSNSPSGTPLKPGLHLILCSRVSSVFGNEPGCVQYLPFTKNTWEKLARDFHVSLDVRRVISRLVPCFFPAREQDEASGKLKMYFTARMSSSLPEDLALSTTHIPSTGSTFAVVYGCNDKQMSDIEKRVLRADKQLQHPLLIPGIFAELERTRLTDMVESLLDGFTLRSEPLKLAPNADSWSLDAEVKGKMAQRQLSLCLESRDLISHISAVKRQLSKLLKEMDVVEQEMESLGPENLEVRNHTRGTALSETGAKLKHRMEDIMIEYDDKIDDCNMIICNTSLAMQTVWNHIARKDSRTNTAIAFQTKIESSQMRTIALLTMIYLPLSSVAAIFSMDMFNWGAIEGESIVSKHIWLFVVLATGLTMLTVAAWFLGTRREKAMAAKSDEYFDSPHRVQSFGSV